MSRYKHSKKVACSRRLWNNLEGSLFFSGSPFSLFISFVIDLVMSFIFRDPFFDGFDDFMNGAFSSKFMNPDRWGIEDEVVPKKHAKKASAKNHDSLVGVSKNNKITPFSGFGRMDMRESDKDYQLSVDIPGMDKDGIKVTSREQRAGDRGRAVSRRRRARRTASTTSSRDTLAASAVR